LTVHRVLSNDRMTLNANIINTDATVIDNKNSKKINKKCNSSVSADCHRILETLGYYTSTGSKLPVIINHGIMSSSAHWLLLGPHKALR